MSRRICYIIFHLLLLAGYYAPAQNITGTWEGYMTDEFIQINIEQRGNELCGYTYDYVLKNKRDHCISNFDGSYYPDKKIWFFSGKGFVENSGNHVLMHLMLWNEKEDGKNILRGKVYRQSSINTIFGMGGDPMIVRRVSSKPQELGSVMPACFPKPNKPVTKQPVPKQSSPASPTTPVKEVPKPKQPQTSTQAKPSTPVPVAPTVKAPVVTDTLSKNNPFIKLPINDKEIISKMNSRKSMEQNRLEVNVKKINLKVYDNGVVDNDTVSIFYNGKLLLSHQLLSETAIELNIDLDENISYHEITLYAENLGGIPPNTALIVITAAGKRYELRSKASLQENAVLVIEYKPG